MAEASKPRRWKVAGTPKGGGKRTQYINAPDEATARRVAEQELNMVVESVEPAPLARGPRGTSVVAANCFVLAALGVLVAFDGSVILAVFSVGLFIGGMLLLIVGALNRIAERLEAGDDKES